MRKRIQMLLFAAFAVETISIAGNAAIAQTSVSPPVGPDSAALACDGSYVRPKNTNLLIMVGCMIVTKELTVRGGGGCSNPNTDVTLPPNGRYAIWRESRFTEGGDACLIVTPDIDVAADFAGPIVLPWDWEKQGITIEHFIGIRKYLLGARDETVRLAWDYLTRRWTDAPETEFIKGKGPPGPASSAAAPKSSGDLTRRAGGSHGSVSGNACVQSNDLAPGMAEAISSQVQYVVAPKGGEKSDDIALYEPIADEYVERQKIQNPFARTRTRYFALKSLKYDATGSVDGQPHHIALIDLPADTAVEGIAVGLTYDLRIVASQRGLALLKPKTLQALFQKSSPVRFNIAWDEIDNDGKLKPTQYFNSFAALPADATVAPRVALTGDQFGKLMNDIVDVLTSASVRFDHMMMVKGDWAAPSTVIATLKRLADAKKEQGSFGYWLTIYSERTSAYGNAYLKAALDVEGIGKLEEARSDNGPLIAEPQKLQLNIAEEAKSKAIREKRPAAASIDKATTDVLGIGETGFLMERKQATNLRDQLVQLTDEFRREAASTDAQQSGGKPIQVRLEEKVPGLKVPRTAATWYRRTIALLSVEDRKEATDSVASATDAIGKLLMENRCDRVYISDKMLGWTAR